MSPPDHRQGEPARVLAIGNMYPPHHLGGYELVWQSAVAALRAGGHEVRVVTTDHRQPGVAADASADVDVRRELRWYWRDHAFPALSPRSRLALERHNREVLRRHLAELGPDVVAWWAMGGMSLSLVEQVRRAGIPAVGFVHDDWLCYGSEVDAWMRMFGGRGRRLATLAERLTGIPARLDAGGAARWLFVSDFTRQRALERWDLPDTGIAHSGIDPSFIAPAPERPWAWRMLSVGRIDHRKGIDTAIDALAGLPREATLTIVGEGDAEHLADLRAQVARLGLDGRVTFAGGRARAELPAIYAEHDVVVFPVRWDEPWGLVPIEAMACGRPVVASGRGGSAEYLRDGENALLAPADDPESLAGAVHRVAGDAALRAHLRERGLETARRHTSKAFDAAVIDAIEQAARPAAVR